MEIIFVQKYFIEVLVSHDYAAIFTFFILLYKTGLNGL